MNFAKTLINTFACLSITSSLLLFGNMACAAPSGDSIKLAKEIISTYKTLRSDCARSEGEARKLCMYRLRVSAWDYREAKKIMSEVKAIEKSRYATGESLAEIIEKSS